MRSRLTTAAVVVAVGLVALLAVDRIGSDPAPAAAPSLSTPSSSSFRSPTPSRDPETGLRWVDAARLPPEAQRMLSLIDRGGPYRYDQDGADLRQPRAHPPRPAPRLLPGVHRRAHPARTTGAPGGSSPATGTGSSSTPGTTTRPSSGSADDRHHRSGRRFADPRGLPGAGRTDRDRPGPRRSGLDAGRGAGGGAYPGLLRRDRPRAGAPRSISAATPTPSGTP